MNSGIIYKLILLFCFCLFISSCYNECKNSKTPKGTQKNENNVTYVKVCIENHFFIATQDASGIWQYTGPLEICE